MSADSQGSEAPLSTPSTPTPPSPPSSPLPDITTTSSSLSDAPSSAGPVAAFTADPGSAESVSVLHLLFDVALVFGPVIGYLMQWRTMWSEKSCDGYSAGVSLILLLCNSVRLGYRVGETFADALMYQSVVMIAVQLGILLTVSSLKRTHALITSVESGHASNVGIPPRPDVGNPSSSSLRALGQVALQQLWHAVRHPSDSIEELLLMPPLQLCVKYVFVLGGTLLLGYLASLVGSGGPTAMGYLALGIEATLVTPQIWLNYQRGSTEGLSLFLVVTWCVGDLVKMIYFLAEHQPAPFVYCGVFQLCCDGIVVLQLWRYQLHGKRSYGVSIRSAAETGELDDMTSSQVTAAGPSGALSSSTSVSVAHHEATGLSISPDLLNSAGNASIASSQPRTATPGGGSSSQERRISTPVSSGTAKVLRPKKKD